MGSAEFKIEVKYYTINEIYEPEFEKINVDDTIIFHYSDNRIELKCIDVGKWSYGDIMRTFVSIDTTNDITIRIISNNGNIYTCEIIFTDNKRYELRTKNSIYYSDAFTVEKNKNNTMDVKFKILKKY